jgi:cadherin 5 type 2 (VE-cadherin)
MNWYNLFLYNPDRTLQDRAQVDPLVQSFSFQNLLQGRMYKMVIVTHSGELSNEAFIFGRTGKTPTQAAMNNKEIVTIFTDSSLICS